MEFSPLECQLLSIASLAEVLDRGRPMLAAHSGSPIERCVTSSVLRPAACVANRVAGSQILVAVKEARDLLFQLSRKEWLGEGHGTREKFPAELPWADHSSA